MNPLTPEQNWLDGFGTIDVPLVTPVQGDPIAAASPAAQMYNVPVCGPDDLLGRVMPVAVPSANLLPGE